jgi:lycopene beta-cyclase
MKKYDLIIAGAGLAGLSLVYHLRQNKATRHLRILLADREPKTANDRTWSFWQEGAGIFDNLVHHSWQRVHFFSPKFSETLRLAPYRYKMIRGQDFYAFMSDFVARDTNIDTLFGEISQLSQTADTASICIDNVPFTADFVCSSINATPPVQPNKMYLLQHFKGWVIKTPDPQFDASVATLMDFTIDQMGDCRFVYVLPTDAHTAMVEYTVFSETILEQPFYDEQLRLYIKNTLQLTDYKITHTEFGIIPMTNAHFENKIGERIFRIGTAGGNTKPSSGYTFTMIQKTAGSMAAYYAKHLSLLGFRAATYPKYDWFDSTLLHILHYRKLPIRDVFADLFRRNPPQRVLRFLDNETSTTDDLKIMASVPIAKFLPAALRELPILWQ